MAFNAEQLPRIGQTTADNGAVVSFFMHATTAAAAAVTAAGYFNPAREKVKVGDIVIASCGLGGTATTNVLRFATVPAAPGNITVVSGVTP